MATSVVPPVPTEERMKKGDVEGIKVEDVEKNEDVDAMDVEQTSTQPPIKVGAEHASEHPPEKPTSISTDGRKAGGVLHAH